MCKSFIQLSVFLVWTLLSYSASANSLAKVGANTGTNTGAQSRAKTVSNAATDLKGLVDPTRPPGAKAMAGSDTGKATTPAWRVSSILIAKDRRLARINGKLVRVGQQVNGATVVTIEATEVWLKDDQKRFKINLLGAKIKEISRFADK